MDNMPANTILPLRRISSSGVRAYSFQDLRLLCTALYTIVHVFSIQPPNSSNVVLFLNFVSYSRFAHRTETGLSQRGLAWIAANARKGTHDLFSHLPASSIRVLSVIGRSNNSFFGT